MLLGILPDVYFQHYFLLVHATFVLLQSSISTDDIDTAEAILQHLVYLTPIMLAERYMTANTHDLLHLADCVRDAGLLNFLSCFALEYMNHELIPGTKAVRTNSCILYATQCGPSLGLVTYFLCIQSTTNSRVVAVGRRYSTLWSVLPKTDPQEQQQGT